MYPVPRRFLQACVLWAGLTVFGATEAASAADAVSREDLERREDLAESLANSLHELSFAFRQRDMTKFADHLAPEFRGTGLPLGDTTVASELSYVRYREAQSVRQLDRDAFLAAWSEYLASFQAIDDVRLKVKAVKSVSADSPASMKTEMKFYWVTRNADGHREWVKGVGKLEARQRDDSHWELTHWSIGETKAMIATQELFSEVGLNAGVEHTVPPWGEPGNEAFMSHGVAMDDVDQDGDLDLFVTGGQENYLYLNRGDGTFENQALEALIITPPATATGPLFVDYHNDGDSDLFLAAIGNQMLFENRLVPDGNLEFWEVSEDAGVALPAEGYSAISADVNGDGYPDVYVASYNKYGAIMPDSWSDAQNGTPNLLFLSNGDGTFTEGGAAWGVADSRWSYAAHFGDLTGDGKPDLYVANDFGVNSLFVHEGDRYVDRGAQFGLNDTGNGMGVSLGDYNNDGLVDVHVTNMSSTAGKRILKQLFPGQAATAELPTMLHKLAHGNTLFQNAGGGKFTDVSDDVGPFGAGWAFGGGFLDFDNDGWDDLHTPNGFISGKDLKDT